MIDTAFIKQIEESHFRTNEDTGANSNALFIWNLVRQHIGLHILRLDDLPAYCSAHGKYHVINREYGCLRKNK